MVLLGCYGPAVLIVPSPENLLEMEISNLTADPLNKKFGRHIASY